MPAPWIAVQFVDRVHHSCPQRIQMDVADQLQKVGVLLAGYRFVAVLKQVPRTFVPQVEDNGVTGQENLRGQGSTIDKL